MDSTFSDVQMTKAAFGCVCGSKVVFANSLLETGRVLKIDADPVENGIYELVAWQQQPYTSEWTLWMGIRAGDGLGYGPHRCPARCCLCGVPRYIADTVECEHLYKDTMKGSQE